MGDFLAGFFTPLAFGWLVYGYLLQSKELRLQREELALTREQLGKQTELIKEQVTADYHDSIPHLTLRIASIENWWDWIFENRGGEANNVELWNLDLNQKVDERIPWRAMSFSFLQSKRPTLLNMRLASARVVRKVSAMLANR